MGRNFRCIIDPKRKLGIFGLNWALSSQKRSDPPGNIENFLPQCIVTLKLKAKDLRSHTFFQQITRLEKLILDWETSDCEVNFHFYKYFPLEYIKINGMKKYEHHTLKISIFYLYLDSTETWLAYCKRSTNWKRWRILYAIWS